MIKVGNFYHIVESSFYNKKYNRKINIFNTYKVTRIEYKKCYCSLDEFVLSTYSYNKLINYSDNSLRKLCHKINQYYNYPKDSIELESFVYFVFCDVYQDVDVEEDISYPINFVHNSIEDALKCKDLVYRLNNILHEDLNEKSFINRYFK